MSCATGLTIAPIRVGGSDPIHAPETDEPESSLRVCPDGRHFGQPEAELAGKARQAFTCPEHDLSIHLCSSKTALEHGASLGDHRQPDALDPWRTHTLGEAMGTAPGTLWPSEADFLAVRAGRPLVYFQRQALCHTAEEKGDLGWTAEHNSRWSNRLRENSSGRTMPSASG